MSAPTDEQMARLRLMVRKPDEWDLSPNDIEALEAIASDYATLRSKYETLLGAVGAMDKWTRGCVCPTDKCYGDCCAAILRAAYARVTG